MRIILLVIAIVVLNVIFADRYLIPTKQIPADLIIYSDKSAEVPDDRVLLGSRVFLDEGNQIVSEGFQRVGKYKVAVNGERYISYAPQNLTSFKAVEMPNGTYELTDLNILIQYEDAALLSMIKSDYGLTELETSYIMQQIFEAVEYCHSIGIVLRNLNPDSIILI